MTKKIFLFRYFYILIPLLMWVSSYSQNERLTNYFQKKVDISNEKVEHFTSSLEFDSLLVIHFHPTAQCSCCIKVGVYAKEILQKFYAKPYKNGHIIFREHNIDEDSSTAKKYKIFWSALGFQIFSGEKNKFKEIESAWQSCENKDTFFLNLKKELDEFISEEKEGGIQFKIQERDSIKGR